MSDDEMVDAPGESTVQKLRRMVQERAFGDRIVLQYSQGVINPMELAKITGQHPQQIYADIRAGKLTYVTDNNTQKKTIPNAIALEYAGRYLDRKAAKLLQREQEARAMGKAS